MSAEMSTFRFGWITPLAVTIEMRSRRVTSSVRTCCPYRGWKAIAMPVVPSTSTASPPRSRASSFCSLP
jgi:hypothetical protein